MNTRQKWEVSQDLSTSIMYVNEMKDHPQKHPIYFIFSMMSQIVVYFDHVLRHIIPDKVGE
jgi:hypothetical protein